MFSFLEIDKNLVILKISKLSTNFLCYIFSGEKALLCSLYKFWLNVSVFNSDRVRRAYVETQRIE